MILSAPPPLPQLVEASSVISKGISPQMPADGLYVAILNAQGTSMVQPLPEVSMTSNLKRHFLCVYPPDALAHGESGVVTIKAIVGKDGYVKELRATKGTFDLRKEALRKVATWVYAPYLVNGEPTEVSTTINIDFTLSDKKQAMPNVDMVVGPVQDGPTVLSAGYIPKPVPEGTVRLPPFKAESLLDHKVAPIYPPTAKKDGVTGSVSLHVLIDKTGKVILAEPIPMGTPMFYSAAADAVRQWNYKPFLINGEPQEVDTTVFVQFQ